MTQTPKRRGLRLSLRGLLLVVTALAIWLGYNVNVVRQRKAMLAELRDVPIEDLKAGKFIWVRVARTPNDLRPILLRRAPMPEVSFLRRQLGDEPIDMIDFALRPPDAEFDAVAKLFPEAIIQ